METWREEYESETYKGNLYNYSTDDEEILVYTIAINADSPEFTKTDSKETDLLLKEIEQSLKETITKQTNEFVLNHMECGVSMEDFEFDEYDSPIRLFDMQLELIPFKGIEIDEDKIIKWWEEYPLFLNHEIDIDERFEDNLDYVEPEEKEFKATTKILNDKEFEFSF